MVRLGAAKIILACRSTEKGEKAKSDIENTTGKTGVIEVWQLDLSSYESTKEFAKRAQGLTRLDGVLENAGMQTRDFRMAEDNEITITTNVVSTFLLAFLLLPKLKESAVKFNIRPHLTIVSSDVHFMTNMPERKKPGKIFDNLNDKSSARMFDRYNVSKMLDVLSTRALAAEAGKDCPVIINTVNPGLCHSELMREVGVLQYVIKFLLGARTTEVGSRTFVWAIAAGPESHGCYTASARIEEPSHFVTSEDGIKTQNRVWEELKDKLERIEPGVTQRI